MNNIKKLSTYIFLLICLLLILFGIFVLHSNKNLKSKVDSAENFELIFYYKEKRGKELIIDKENGLYNYNIYVVNGTVDIVIDKKNYSLEDALNNKRVTMEKIIEKAKKEACDEQNVTFIEATDFLNGYEAFYKSAVGAEVNGNDGSKHSIADGTVAAHPNDEGMACIAQLFINHIKVNN